MAFSRELARHLPTAEVYLLATSATEVVIIQAREQLIRELGVTGMDQEVQRSRGTSALRVGPFSHRESRADHYFELPLNRALMVIWVAHFVARMHRMFRLQLQGSQVEPVVVDWFFYHDKFAGDSEPRQRKAPKNRQLPTMQRMEGVVNGDGGTYGVMAISC